MLGGSHGESLQDGVQSIVSPIGGFDLGTHDAEQAELLALGQCVLEHLG
jgi:hypothetical protein